MWSDYLNKNKFLISLYDCMPILNNVRIKQFRISCDGNRVELVFDMPMYANYPPSKWIEYKCDTVIVQIDFESIKSLNFKFKDINCIGDIDILLDKNKMINLKIRGDVEVNLLAEIAFVQKVEGYCLRK